MLMENNGKAVSVAKEQLAVKAAVAACDALDGVADGVLRDPRACNYSATDLVCKPGKHLGCLTMARRRRMNSGTGSSCSGSPSRTPSQWMKRLGAQLSFVRHFTRSRTF